MKNSKLFVVMVCQELQALGEKEINLNALIAIENVAERFIREGLMKDTEAPQ